MQFETILLQFLIVFIPYLLYHIFFEHKNIGKSPLMQGFLQGIAVFFCLLFSIHDFDITLNFSFVPLILSFIYGGIKSGFVTYIIFLLLNILFGSEYVFIDIVISTITILFILIFGKNLWNKEDSERMKITIGFGFIHLIITTTTLYFFASLESFDYSYTIFVVFGILSLYLAIKLNEKIIERRKIKKEITKAEKLNTIGQLAASIAHEVRNPLTVVNGFLQIMNKDESTKNKEYIQLILNELKRAELIINDYLNFAKPQLEKVERIDISKVLQEVSTVLSAYAIKNGVELIHHVEPSIFINTDRNQLKQVFVNIIKNAIEATPNGGLVQVNLKKENQNAVITVIDNGRGMSKEELDQLGNLFFTTKEFGTGLGISVAQNIIKKMNGRMIYTSKLGEGTTVHITIPIKS